MRDFSIVVAIDAERGIGLNGGLPWRLPGDVAYFKRITQQAPEALRNAVIMGRKTYESIPARFRPLSGRLNVVLTRSASEAGDSGPLFSSSLPAALERLDTESGLHRLFVIGGGEVYREALSHPGCQALYVTRLTPSFACDTHFPAFEAAFQRVTRSQPQHESGIDYTFEVYERRA